MTVSRRDRGRQNRRGKDVILMSENPKYPPRYILESDELSIWGVITGSVRSHV